MSANRPEPASRYFTPNALSDLRATIEDHGGHEVFFVGRPGEVTGKIQVVEALARGNGNQVPAILDCARPGEVVIHNHPSGVLVPSDPDLALASHYGNCAVGFLIIDNRAEEVTVVIKPFQKPTRKKIDPAELDSRIGQRGQLARTLPGYEWRPGQLEMANTVLKAFNDDGVAVIEAGTGTGKSLAYLLPAALYALANKETVVVATHTINLQEQLHTKDAPQLEKLEGLKDLEVALLKGRSNYLCNRKFEYYRDTPGELFDTAAAKLLGDLERWYKSTPSGTRSDLNFQLPEDLWERLAADEDDCTRVKCRYYEDCFYFNARKAAASAQVHIVNQHLLMADLALRHATGEYKRAMVLPPYKRVILDEAHHLEEVATSFISGKVTIRSLVKLLGRLVGAKSRRADGTESRERRGLLVLLATKLPASNADESVRFKIDKILRDDLEPRVESLRRMARAYLADIAFQLRHDMETRTGRVELQFRIRPEFEQNDLWIEVIRERLQELQVSLSELGAHLQNLVKTFETLPEKFRSDEQQIGLELGSIRTKLLSHGARLSEFLTGGENLVRWLELERIDTAEPSVAICTSPIDVATLLNEMVYEPLKTSVLTSATLSVSGRFDYMQQRVGLSRVPSARLECKSIPSPFDYATQVYLGIPSDFPDPRDRGYQERLIDTVEAAIERSRGGAFVLFTSYQLLNAVHDALKQRARLTYPFLKQGEESRHRLLARFKSESNAVLFGTDSFWEGVDVQGEALRLVIITRLPFSVPSEPIQEARAEAVTAAGGDPFRDISLPQAVIQFKQGFGRLIRHREDRGVVLVLDQRIISKAYGRHFLEAVHGVDPVAGPVESVLADIGAFFDGTYVRPAKRAIPGRSGNAPWQSVGLGRSGGPARGFPRPSRQVDPEGFDEGYAQPVPYGEPGADDALPLAADPSPPPYRRRLPWERG